MSQGPYTVRTILKENSGAGAAAFYLALLSIRNKSGFSVTRTTLSEQTGFTDSNTISQYLSVLVKAGWVNRRTTGRGTNRRIQIKFLLPDLLPPAVDVWVEKPFTD